MNAFVIDAFDFSRIGASREGVTPVAEMVRLTRDCADNSGEIAWKIAGSTSKQGYPELTLSVSGKVQLVCQRCLAPFAYDIDSSTKLMLGKDDAHADEIEEIIADESVDVIVGSRSMDAMALIEDEALLALPQVPKHDVCPDTAQLDALKTEKEVALCGAEELEARISSGNERVKRVL